MDERLTRKHWQPLALVCLAIFAGVGVDVALVHAGAGFWVAAIGGFLLALLGAGVLA